MRTQTVGHSSMSGKKKVSMSTLLILECFSLCIRKGKGLHSSSASPNEARFIVKKTKMYWLPVVRVPGEKRSQFKWRPDLMQYTSDSEIDAEYDNQFPVTHHPEQQPQMASSDVQVLSHLIKVQLQCNAA